MKSQIFDYYQSELTFLKQEGEKFAVSYPNLAKHLKLNIKHNPDPHVERLIESVALMNARIHQRLDEDIFDFSESLLRVLYPHYLRPIPSCSIMQFHAPADLTISYTIARGLLIETDPTKHSNCKFKTVYPVTLYPMEINSAEYDMKPFARDVQVAEDIHAMLSIDIQTLDENLTIEGIKPGKIRLYLHGQSDFQNRLYEQIAYHCQGLCFKSGNLTLNVGKEHIIPVGFSSEDNLLPYPPQTLSGYRLLTEYTVFPEKFLFFDIEVPPELHRNNNSDVLTIHVLFDQATSDFDCINATHLQLNCTPIINLFEQQAEPVLVEHKQMDYPIIPDARSESPKEIYQVSKVLLAYEDQPLRECKPMFEFNHFDAESQVDYYHIQTDKHFANYADNQVEQLNISFTDINFNALKDDKTIVYIDLLCSNHQMPYKLSTECPDIYLQLAEDGPDLKSLKLLTPFTPSFRMPIGKQNYWKLVSHVSTNMISFENNSQVLNKLKETIGLYHFGNLEDKSHIFNHVVDVSCERKMKPLFQEAYMLSYGYVINIFVDDQFIKKKDAYLFFRVLYSFLLSQCPLNHYCELRITQEKTNQEIYKWQVTNGNCPLF